MVSASLDQGKVVNACYIKCVCFMAQHQKRLAVLLSAAFFVYIACRWYKNLFFKQDPTLDKQKPAVKKYIGLTVRLPRWDENIKSHGPSSLTDQTPFPKPSRSAINTTRPGVFSRWKRWRTQ